MTRVWAALLVLVLAWQVSPVRAESVRSRMGQGIKLYQQGNYDQALDKFLAAQVEDPENTQLSYNLGNAYYKMQDYEKAVNSYMHSALNAEDSRLAEKSYYNLGNAFYRQGKLQEALGYYQQALEIDPNDLDAKKNLEFVQKMIERHQQQQQQQQKSGEQGEQQQGEQQQDQSQPGEKQEQAKEGKKAEDKQQKQAQKQEQQKKEQEGEKGKAQPAAEKEKNKEGKDQEDKPAKAAKQMSEEEAQRWLDLLTEDRREFIKQQISKEQSESYSSEKDW